MPRSRTKPRTGRPRNQGPPPPIDPKDVVIHQRTSGPPPDWKERFLSALAEFGVVRAAREVAGVSPTMLYKERLADPEFAKRWQEALEDSYDSLEQEARRRAMSTSDTLLIFLLKGARPERFRDNQSVTISGDPNAPMRIAVAFAEVPPGLAGVLSPIPALEANTAALTDAINADPTPNGHSGRDGDPEA